MKSVWRSIVLVLVLGSGAFSDLHSQSVHPPFMVGVLQSDGVLIPVARFEAGEWTAPWPEGDGVAPASLAAVPDSWWPGFSGRTWSASLPGGSRALTLLQPTTIAAGCQKVVGLKTDYVNSPPIGDSRYVHPIAIAAAGDVTLRAVRTLDVNSPKDAEWAAAERQLFNTLEAMKRPTTGLLLQYRSRILREEGGDVSLFEAVGERRSVRLIVSDNERGQFVMLKDAAASRDRELVGALTPLGTIWGLDRLAVLAWEQGYDGGRYSIVTITAEGLSWMISAGARGC
jgi:hypothetical protein